MYFSPKNNLLVHLTLVIVLMKLALGLWRGKHTTLTSQVPTGPMKSQLQHFLLSWLLFPTVALYGWGQHSDSDWQCCKRLTCPQTMLIYSVSLSELWQLSISNSLLGNSFNVLPFENLKYLARICCESPCSVFFGLQMNGASTILCVQLLVFVALL